MSTSRNIHLELYQARLLYNTLPGYMMGGIKQILIDEYGYRNLVFNPNLNDILVSDDHIILFNKFSDIEPTSNRNLGRNVLGLIVYNISEDTIYMNSDCDIQVLSTDENIVNILHDIGAELGYNPLRFEICPYDMGSEFCPECGIEWENVTVIEYIRLVRDGILPNGYQNGDVDINVIYNLQSKFKDE